MNESNHSPESGKGESGQPASPSRRHFLNYLLGTTLFAWLASAAYPVIRYLLPPKGPPIKQRSVDLGSEKKYAKDSGTMFRIGNKPGILIRTPTGEFRAFIAICTHLGCTVQFRKDWGVIWCACHNGRYNLQGINISGPPPRPLTPLVVSLVGEKVHVSFSS